MPLYKYRCLNCEIEFEKIMTMSEKCNDKTVITCSSCGCGENMPILAKTSFSLKGDGWYKDGYKRKDP